MPETSRVPSPTASEIPSDLQQLAHAIQALPATHAAELGPLVDRVVESTTRRRRILTLVQDALSQLRLDMKYLMFDLEATRRERDEYRSRLEEE
ncbi:MAG: transcriptional regulator [Planctomycetota bacterium]